MRPVLLRIPFSHYCQKAEWALTYHGIAYDTVDIGLAQMRKWMPHLPEGTVPVLVPDPDTPAVNRPPGAPGVVAGSSAIVCWADRNSQRRVPALGGDEDVAAWEAWADSEVGPVARREAYRCIHDRPSHYGHKRALHVVFRLARPVIVNVQKHYKSRRYDAHDEEMVPEILARIQAQLDATGTGYLFANRVTAADLATAALWKPMLAIYDHPARRLPEWDTVAEYVRRVKPDATTRVKKRRWRPRHWVF